MPGSWDNKDLRNTKHNIYYIYKPKLKRNSNKPKTNQRKESTFKTKGKYSAAQLDMWSGKEEPACLWVSPEVVSQCRAPWSSLS